MTDRRPPDGLLLYGHRGSSARYPENTLLAFREALREGANALEMDVHKTADGSFVLCHDDDGWRTAGVASRIRDLPLEQVREWDAGWGLVDAAGRRPFAGTGITIPTLEEVVQELPEVPISLDIKPADVDDVPALVELLVRLGAAHRVTLASFHEGVVSAARALDYPGPTGLTRPEIRSIRMLPTPVPRAMIGGQAALIPVHVGRVRLDTRRFLGRCRQLGLRVDYWVVNDPAQARELVRRGATGVMTDQPAVLAPVIQELQRELDGGGGA